MNVIHVDYCKGWDCDNLIRNLLSWDVKLTLADILKRFNATFDVDAKCYIYNDDVDDIEGIVRTLLHNGPDGLFCFVWTPTKEKR